MSALRALPLPRRPIRLAGEGARAFLQDLVTNDVGPAAADRAVYAALLTPQGKFVADFFVLAAGTDPDDLILDVAADHAPALAQRLAAYRLRRPLEIGDTGLGVAAVWGGDPGAAPAGATLVADPRDPALGHRLLAPRGELEAAVDALGAARATAAEHAALRVAVGAPETGVELTPDSYVLEMGFERLRGVDFRKGCFVGQEVVSRMKRKAELRKGLVRVAVDGPAPDPGTEVTAADGRPAGTLFTVADGTGLAHLRFDRTDGDMRAGGAVLRLADAPVAGGA